MDYIEQCEGLALLPDTVLHDCIRILDIEEINENDIVYIAELTESGEEISIREFCPVKLVKREGLELSCPEHEKIFREKLKQFEQIGQILKEGVPYMPRVFDFWYENRTAYYAVKLSDGDSFRRTIPIPTAIYVQSLGVMLCDMYSRLHQKGLFYGAISEKDITFMENGSMVLEPHITGDGTITEDLHCFTDFLRRLLSETVEAKENLLNRPAFTVMQQALQCHYENISLLKSALMGVSDDRSHTKRSHKVSNALNGLLAITLVMAVLGTVFSAKNQLAPSVQEIKAETIQPEIISVWIPLDSNVDESQQQEMYQKLAQGFEQQYHGFGVNISLYDTTAFSDALDSMDGEMMPAVFMNTLDNRVIQKACDLSSLEFSIDNHYVADLEGFGNVLPLGCSVPVLYCNRYVSPNGNRTISGGELPSDTLYDVSAEDFITKQSTHEPKELLKSFLEDGSHPLLGSTDILAQIQNSGENSGAVQMIPVTTSDNACALQYEYYCTVNRDCSPNTQQAGMLWLQYLLTEEAQTILFVENVCALPLHEKAVATAINTNQMLQVLGGMKFDSSVLQEKR